MPSLSCGTVYITIIYFYSVFSIPNAVRIPKLSNVRFWWFGGRVIPDLIPNSAVKPPSGDGTHRYRWEE